MTLECAFCGEPAPSKKQWWNRDTGYGCCPRCFQAMVAKDGLQYALFTCGRPGLHHSVDEPLYEGPITNPDPESGFRAPNA